MYCSTRSATSGGTGKRYRPDHRDDRLQRPRTRSVRTPIVAARAGAQSNRRPAEFAIISFIRHRIMETPFDVSSRGQGRSGIHYSHCDWQRI